jgi:SRSO17 transposase
VRLDKEGRSCGDAISVKEMDEAMGKFRRVTWRRGTKSKLSSRFRFVRVKTTHDDGVALADREPLWLIIEWPAGEPTPSKYVLTTLPQRMSNKEIVRLFKERWRVERMFEDLKGELGLDHFEGRSYPGWHHHISVVLCCYAFVSAERARDFPPSGEQTGGDDALHIAA